MIQNDLNKIFVRLGEETEALVKDCQFSIKEEADRPGKSFIIDCPSEADFYDLPGRVGHHIRSAIRSSEKAICRIIYRSPQGEKYITPVDLPN